MKKIIPLFIGVIVTLQTIIPPLELSINFTNSPMRFTWTFLFCGILSFYFIFTKANPWFKILLPYLFLNTFLSKIPHLSMASFIWTTIGAYFYLLCTKIEDWRPIFKFIASILFLEILLFCLKYFGKETLLNFGAGSVSCFGTVGNDMQFKSLIIILCAFLIQLWHPAKKKLLIAYISLAILALVYFFAHAWQYFLYARGGVWIETIKLWSKNFWTGNGLDTFKVIFPALGRGHFETEGIWTSAHNDYLQLLFETGAIGFTILVAYSISLLRKARGVLLLGGLFVLFTLCVHFPMHQNSTILLIPLFIAYIEKKLKEERWPLQ